MMGDEPKKMLILRGNKGHYADEQGKDHNYEKGALHEQAAKDFAACKNLVGEVLLDPGNQDPDGDNNPQTVNALAKLRDKKSPYAGLYGFSGGGYNVLHILNHLSNDELERIKWVVVLGAPPVRSKKTGKIVGPFEADYLASTFAKKRADDKIDWTLVYPKGQNPGDDFKTPNGAGKHMFGPEWLLHEQQCSKP
jgi:hypothetical protein